MNLSETEPLQVMLSSRASDKIIFEGNLQELSVLRRAIKAQLESVKIGDVSFFKVWIHEDDAFQPGDADSWEKCMEKAHGRPIGMLFSQNLRNSELRGLPKRIA